MSPIPEPPVTGTEDSDPDAAAAALKQAGRRKADPSGGRPPRATSSWMRMAAFAAAMVMTTSAGIGVGSMVSDAPPLGTVPLAFYITDAPAELTALDVSIASVTAGPGRIPLEIMSPSFDLAALHGPDAAILLARGHVPPDAIDAVEVTFSSAKATVDNQTFDVPLVQTLVIKGMRGPATTSPTFLIDVDLPSSLTVGSDGQLVFAPVPAAVLADHGTAKGAPKWAPVQASYLPAPRGLEPAGISLPVERAPPGGTAGGQRGGVAAPPWNTTGPAEVVMDGAVVESGTVPGWFVLFDDANMSRADMQAAVGVTGAVFVTSLHALPAAYILASVEQAQWLADHPRVERVEAEVPIQFHDAESREAIRMPSLLDPVTGPRDSQGRLLDGHGIGVAVVDTGIDATHPAFQRSGLVGDSAVAKNLKVVSRAYVPLPNTDTTGGHGTHVAAVIGGQQGADSALPGIAPGATLYGLGVGEAKSIVWAAQAFDWILQNHDQVDPPIRVVTNSWGSDAPYDPNSVVTRLVNQMARQDIVVVFSAGNAGGDGSTARTSAQCQIPTPGVICVAAYDDRGSGTRDGEIAPYSSRGKQSDPWTWPDVSAPGTDVRSARTVAGYSTGVGFYRYVELSGTSQAAPHVAGVAALMLQMDPALEASEVEAQMRVTAHEFDHGGGYHPLGHYAKGHGLVDAHAAVAAVG